MNGRRARHLVTLAFVLFVAACAEVLPVGPAPAVGEASDGAFVLVVRSPADRYPAGQPIEVFAEVVYQGQKATETIYHGASPVGWEIVQLDGPARMEGGMDVPCLSTDVTPGRVRRYPFEKSGGIDDVGPFDRAWFEAEGLTLPVGRWRIIGSLIVSLDDCGGQPHHLQASIDLLVGPSP